MGDLSSFVSVFGLATDMGGLYSFVSVFFSCLQLCIGCYVYSIALDEMSAVVYWMSSLQLLLDVMSTVFHWGLRLQKYIECHVYSTVFDVIFTVLY